MEEFTETSRKIKNNRGIGDVNTIYPFIEVEQGKKLSIVGIYDNTENSIVNGIGESIPFVEDEYYYGLSPEFGADEVCDAIKRGCFSETSIFEKFLNDNAKLFTLPDSMSKYARALFAKTLVKLSTIFGYKFDCQNYESYNLFCKSIGRIAKMHIEYDLNESVLGIRLLGQPREQILKILDENFVFNSNGKLDIKKNTQENNVFKFISSHNISLVQGKVYYSGVLPRVKKFIWQDLNSSNPEIKSLGIMFGRSTFASMDAFDSSYIKEHWLLEKYVKTLEDLDRNEDSLMHEFLDKPSVENINSFLEKSYTAHNLAVSGNVITADGYLLLAKRGQKTIDKNSYYCSINGQSEIYDNRVSFYKQSVYEDVPTINIENSSRICFMGELERETAGELNITCPASHWLLQGVSFLGVINSNSEKISRRRFHFNILAECTTEYSLAQVIKLQKNASERFENSKIIGVKINRYNNILTKIVSSTKTLFKGLLKSKDLVTSIFALAIFFMGFNELQSAEFTIKSLSSICSIFFTSLSLIFFIKNIIALVIKRVKRKNTHLKFSIIGECDNFYNDVHDHFAHRKINLHPIADVMLYEYIKNSL